MSGLIYILGTYVSCIYYKVLVWQPCTYSIVKMLYCHRSITETLLPGWKRQTNGSRLLRLIKSYFIRKQFSNKSHSIRNYITMWEFPRCEHFLGLWPEFSRCEYCNHTTYTMCSGVHSYICSQKSFKNFIEIFLTICGKYSNEFFKRVIQKRFFFLYNLLILFCVIILLLSRRVLFKCDFKFISLTAIHFVFFLT